MIPHRFPFVFIDRGGGGDGVVMRVTAGGWLNREGHLAPPLAIELMAQAALVELAGSGDHGSRAAVAPAVAGGWPALAGLDSARFAPILAVDPLKAGDVLRAQSHVVGSFGLMTKVQSVLRREDAVVVEAAMLLVAAS